MHATSPLAFGQGPQTQYWGHPPEGKELHQRIAPNKKHLKLGPHLLAEESKGWHGARTLHGPGVVQVHGGSLKEGLMVSDHCHGDETVPGWELRGQLRAPPQSC